MPGASIRPGIRIFLFFHVRYDMLYFFVLSLFLVYGPAIEIALQNWPGCGSVCLLYKWCGQKFLISCAHLPSVVDDLLDVSAPSINNNNPSS